MSALLKLLRSAEVPRGFRLHLADLLAAGLTMDNSEASNLAHGWNAAVRAAGGADLVPESLVPAPGRRHVLRTVSITREGTEVCDEAQVFHPHWRDAIERGEDLPDDEGELFAPGPVTERFVPFEPGEPLFIEAEVADHPGRVHPPQDEVDIVQGEAGHAEDSAAAPAPPSNPSSEGGFADFWAAAVRTGYPAGERSRNLAMSAWDHALCAAQARTFDSRGRMRSAAGITNALAALHTWATPATDPLSTQS